MTGPLLEAVLRLGAMLLILVAVIRGLAAVWLALRGGRVHRRLADAFLVAAIVVAALPSVQVRPIAQTPAEQVPSLDSLDYDHLLLILLPVVVWLWSYRVLPSSIAQSRWMQRIAAARVKYASARLRRRREDSAARGLFTFSVVLELTGQGGNHCWTYVQHQPSRGKKGWVRIKTGQRRLRPGMICVAEVFEEEQSGYDNCRQVVGAPVAVLEPRTWQLGQEGFSP